LGNADFLAEKFGASNVIGGLCFTCINRLNPGVIHSIYHGSVRIAEFKGDSMERVNEIAEVFKQSDIKCAGSPSLNEILWKKLCWNIPFNGLSIVSGGITTDKILENKELYETVCSLMIEVQLIAKAYGVEILDEFLDKQVEITYPMGPYKPSSLIDFLNKRPVEVEAIFGEPLRRAQAKKLSTPHLSKLYASLKAIA
jgi:2-dehydropantoate 2-reductase